MSPAETRPFLTPTEVATLLRVSPITVRQWAQKGKLSAKVTPGGHRRFSPADVEAFARAHGLTLNQNRGAMLKILIVDDDAQFARYLAETLSLLPQPTQTQIARDGFSAGRMMQSFRPEIVLLDLHMPALDGVQVCQQIKLEPALRATRVIAMTGHAEDERITQVLNAGAERCLSKPFTTDALRNALGLRAGEDPSRITSP